MNAITYLASSVSAYQISGRNFQLVGDNVTTRTLDLLCVTLCAYVNLIELSECCLLCDMYVLINGLLL